MSNKTIFFEILLSARSNDEKMMFVIEKIMPLINKYAKIASKQIDEDLKSYLIEYAISVIKSENFAEKLARK